MALTETLTFYGYPVNVCFVPADRLHHDEYRQRSIPLGLGKWLPVWWPQVFTLSSSQRQPALGLQHCTPVNTQYSVCPTAQTFGATHRCVSLRYYDNNVYPVRLYLSVTAVWWCFNILTMVVHQNKVFYCYTWFHCFSSLNIRRIRFWIWSLSTMLHSVDFRITRIPETSNVAAYKSHDSLSLSRSHAAASPASQNQQLWETHHETSGGITKV